NGRVRPRLLSLRVRGGQAALQAPDRGGDALGAHAGAAAFSARVSGARTGLRPRAVQDPWRAVSELRGARRLAPGGARKGAAAPAPPQARATQPPAHLRRR